jgi:hypothetical protein
VVAAASVLFPSFSHSLGSGTLLTKAGDIGAREVSKGMVIE